MPTESQSKSHVGTSCDSQATRHFCRKHFTQIVTALYPILNRLNIQIDIEGASIVLPVVGISWPLTRQNNILTILRHVFQCKAFPNTLIINLPSVSVTNGGQRNPTIPKVSAIPIVASDGNVGWYLLLLITLDLLCILNGVISVSDHFPWAIKIEHYSILTLTHSKDVNYCLHPGSVSATVAVNSKANPVTSTTLTQLSVCIHCDFHPVRLEISNSQVSLLIIFVFK